MSIAVPDRGLATAADLEDLERSEVIEGVVQHKANPAAEHGDAQAGLTTILRPWFHRKGGGDHPGGWWIMTEVEIELEAHEVFLPDITGWRRDRVPERPKGRPVRVRPDWVCEILSPSTAHRDQGTKLRTFQKCGVGHYWIVDPRVETLTVHRWHEDGYLVVLTAGRNDRITAEPFDAIEIQVGLLFGDDPDDE